MGKAISVGIGIVIFVMLTFFTIVNGLRMYDIQQFPSIQTAVERRIASTGGLTDDTIKTLEEVDFQNKVVITRAKYSDTDKRYVATTDNNQTQPYGTRVDYILTRKQTNFGKMELSPEQTIHGYGVTQTRDNSSN